MKRIFLILLLTVIYITANAQVSPESYDITHNDSCWHFTFNYDYPRTRSNEGILVVTHLCTPDTCVSSATRHLQGRKYAKRYVKRYGTAPMLNDKGIDTLTLTVPEDAINDTVYAITYSEYDNGKKTVYSCDTVAICLPEAPPMSCHRAKAAPSIADHMARAIPYMHSMAKYIPLNDSIAASMGITPSVVRYSTKSGKLNPEYLQNAQNIEELVSIIDDILADSTTTLEAIQIVGYTSPDGSEHGIAGLGRKRATAMRNHISKHHNIPDSLFEIADGGNNWRLVYADIRDIGISDSDSLIGCLKAEPDLKKREMILKRFQGGTLYRGFTERMFPAHRMACCTGIYYHNNPDSAVIAINKIVDELIMNPNPDYGKLIKELKRYGNDPRALNLQGVIEYRRHHRHAAKQAFTKAANMGDEQAALNLEIINSK